MTDLRSRRTSVLFRDSHARLAFVLRPTRLLVVATTLIVCSHARVVAQTAAAPEWTFSITPYFWMASLHGDVGVRRLATHVDLSSGDILDVLKFGAMAYGEARYEPYVFGLDGMYTSIGGARTIAFRSDTGTFSLTQKQTMLQPTFGYTIGGSDWSVDGLLGIRYWHLSADLDVDRTRRPSNERSGSVGWADATTGLRVHWMPGSRVGFTAGADGGAGGSHGTWQAYGGIGGNPVSWLTMGVSYRALGVNYDHDETLFDVTLQGVMLSAAFRF